MLRFSRIKIETDFRELEMMVAAAAALLEEPITCMLGIAGRSLSAPPVIATPKQQPVGPDADEVVIGAGTRRAPA